MSQVIVSSVGTSVITNMLNPAERQMLIDAANDANIYHIPYLKVLLDRCHEMLTRNPELVMDAAEMSALSLYAQKVAKTEFMVPEARYVFLVTDTAIGRFCGEVLVKFVRWRYNAIADAYVIEGLQAENIDALDVGFQRLEATLDQLRLQLGLVPPWQRFMSWLGTAPMYQPRMVLNITGGFKIVSGWLQSYATIHGLHCIYTYEAKKGTLIVMRTNAPNTVPRIEYYY